MKKLFSACTIVIATCVTLSCQKSYDEVSVSKEVPSAVLAKIKSMGLDEKTAIYSPKLNRYIVEGDIMLPTDLLSTDKGARQASTNNLVAFSSQQVIRVRIEVGTWNSAIVQAMRDWNSISNNRIKFIFATNQWDLTITSDNGALANNVIASADFPSNGHSGPTIIVNLDYDSGKTVSESSKRYNMVHEMGHTIGFRHTNWSLRGESASPNGANTIAGTPTSDASSVMNGGTADYSWSGFSAYDDIALKNLYPQTIEVSNWISSASADLNNPLVCQGGGYCIIPLTFNLNNTAHASNSYTVEIYVGNEIYSNAGVFTTGNGSFSGYAEMQRPPDAPLRLKVTDVGNPLVYDFINL